MTPKLNFLTKPKLTPVHVAWAFPLIIVAIGLITGALNHPATNGYHGLYWFFSPIWLAAMQALPLAGIIWGFIEIKSTAGKVAVLLNGATLLFSNFKGGGIGY